MRRILLVLCLLVAALATAQPTITQAEYFIGADPGEGSGTAITVTTPSGSVNLGWSIATGSLTPNIYRVMVRVRTNAGLWSRPTAQYLVIAPGSQVAQLVTGYEWSVDGGAYTPVDIADASTVNISQVIATAGLSQAVLHKVNIRVTDNAGRIAQNTQAYLAITPPGQTPRLITQYEYAVDGGAPTVVDVADAAQVNIAEVIATGSLAQGLLHKVKFRVTDDQGRVAQFTEQYLAISPAAQVARNITNYEYWVDSDPPTLVDPADQPAISISELIATNSIPVGLHYLNMRTTDNLGRVGQAHRAAFIVMSPFQASVPRNISAAEFWVNVDPGPGNGIAIPLPNDGAYDEGTEDVDTLLTGLPGGNYIVGFRFRDNTGRWSRNEIDSLHVGPVVVVRVSGTNILLDWTDIPAADQYLIYRAANVGGPFTAVDSTLTNSYTDVGISGVFDRRFYQVTSQSSALANFRMPDLRPVRD